MTFAPGDIVALKSGGYSMTVVSIDADEVDCLWLGDSGELFRQLIPAVALTMVESEDAADEDREQDTAEDDEHDDDADDDEEDEDEDDDEEDDDEGDEKRRAKG